MGLLLSFIILGVFLRMWFILAYVVRTGVKGGCRACSFMLDGVRKGVMLGVVVRKGVILGVVVRICILRLGGVG